MCVWDPRESGPTSGEAAIPGQFGCLPRSGHLPCTNCLSFGRRWPGTDSVGGFQPGVYKRLKGGKEKGGRNEKEANHAAQRGGAAAWRH